MRRVVLVSLTVLCLLFVSSIAGLVQVVRADIGTIYINADGSISPSTAPIYTTDSINYTLTGNITTDVDGIMIERDNIVFDGAGFTISSFGVYLDQVTGVTIKNINIIGYDYGIHLLSCSNTNIIDSNVSSHVQTPQNPGDGIYLENSSNNNVAGNNVGPNMATGIYVDSSSNNDSIINNSLGNNYDDIWLNTSSGNMVSGNYVWGGERFGVKLADSCNHNAITDNTVLYNNDEDISLDSSNYNMLSGNNVTGGSVGIHLDSCISDTLLNDRITDTAYGVLLGSSSYNALIDNNITYSSVSAIHLALSSNNTLQDNDLADNTNGIYLNPSYNNTFCGGEVSNNEYGVRLTYDSSGNAFYRMNFVNNTIQAICGQNANVWDDGREGNYWSDYNGTDNNQDGIGDTPYVIDETNADHYPLMGAFSDFNVAQGADVQVVSNSTVSDFQFNSTALLFDVTGENGTTGFCRISFPTALINGNLTVFVNGTEVPYNLLPESNSTESYLYFTYSHSTKQVTIIPEFPTFILFPLFIIATLIAIVFCRKPCLTKGSSQAETQKS
ncbi:MAG: NosD domain-containing protein [Candidatus Bathyarchaeia archaeon]